MKMPPSFLFKIETTKISQSIVCHQNNQYFFLYSNDGPHHLSKKIQLNHKAHELCSLLMLSFVCLINTFIRLELRWHRH